MNSTKCPVCNTVLNNDIPDLCPTCGWECGIDITLCMSLYEFSQKEREEYNVRLAKAQMIWQKKRDEEDKRKKIEQENERIRKEKAARCSALKTQITGLMRDQECTDAIKLLDEYDNLKPADLWAAEKRRKIFKILDSEQKKIDAKCSALQTSINELIQKQFWAEAEQLLDYYDELKADDKWSVEQRRIIQEIQYKEEEAVQARISALRASINDEMRKKQWNHALAFQDEVNQQIHGSHVPSSLEMIRLDGGSFLMGSVEAPYYPPFHKVQIRPFWIGKYLVTQNQWQMIMGYNPASRYGVGDNHPVYNVSWYDVLKYCNRLSLTEGLTPVYSILGYRDPADWVEVPTENWKDVICDWRVNGYRLPTEAEWEYAARGGNKSKEYKYAGSNDIELVAWYEDNSEGMSHPVGMKKANELGIYDMSGNVWEWCWDWYEDYSTASQTNPIGPDFGEFKVVRNGFFGTNAYRCRIESRSGDFPHCCDYRLGFRLCRSAT